jgi:hypothetical protein
VFPSRFMPCPECGGSVERADQESHACDPERRLDFRMFLLREEILAFERQFHEFAETRDGRFETWVASRTVRGRP